MFTRINHLLSFTCSRRDSCCHRAGCGQRIAPCVVGVARGDGSLRRFRQAVVLVVGIARGVGRAVERLLLRGKVIVVVIAPRDAVCIPAAALLPAHQPILKIVEILRLASARAVCQQAEVAVVVVGVVDLRAVLIADGRGAAKAVVAIGHRIAVAVVGPRELVIAVRAVAVADERPRANNSASNRKCSRPYYCFVQSTTHDSLLLITPADTVALKPHGIK